MKNNVMLIINPTSGLGKGDTYREIIAKKLKKHFKEIDVRTTEKEKDATNFAEYATESGYDSIVVLGGDGTINEVVAGMAEKENRPKLAIIPGGTGNLLARSMGIPMDIDTAIETLQFEKTKYADIGKTGDKYFGYIFSIGKISEAIHNVGVDEKTDLGAFAYFINIVKELLKDEAHMIKVETDNGDYEGPASHVIVLLTNSFGDMKLLDSGDKHGFANVMILKDSNFLTKVNLIPSIIGGKVDNNENVVYLEANKIKITSTEKDIETDVDGEKGENLPAEIEILEKHIEVYCV